MRDGFEDNFASISKMSGSLLAAVLQYDPEAFDFSKASGTSSHLVEFDYDTNEWRFI